jgi:hypothetical protein
MTTTHHPDSPVVEAAPTRRVIRGSLHLVRDGQRLTTRPAPAPARPQKPVAHPKARLLAVGYRLRAAIESGEFENQAQLADALGFSRARVTQLIGLTFQPPWVQEEWLVGG